MRLIGLFGVFLAIGVMAQTGPAGIGGPASNPLWLDAGNGVFKGAGINPAGNGDAVQQWNNVSGNPRHAQQSSAANRPQYRTNVLNGRPTLRFNAPSGTRMAVSSLNSSTAGKASVWAVVSYSSLASPNPGVLQGTAPGNVYSSSPADKNIGLWVSNVNKVWGRGIQSDGTSVNVPAVTSLSANRFYILSTQYDGTRISQYVNNASAGVASYNGTLRPWPEMSIGTQAGTEVWNGDIAEVVAFNTVLNGTQQLVMANYLAAKYGLALGADDIYTQDDPANGDYDHEVAGIGRISATDMHTSAKGTGIVQISGATGLDNNEFLIWGHDGGTLGSWGAGDRPPGVVERLVRTWRVNEVNRSGVAVDVGAVDITFDLSGLGPVVAGDLRLLVDSNNDGAFADELPLAGAVALGGGQYRFNGVTALRNNVRFTLGSANRTTTPLPVELLFFEARPQDRHVQLAWATASEINNAMFAVERSANGINWETVATVPGARNSSQRLEYAQRDDAPLAGTSYYRLRQTDHDGGSTLSEVVPVVRGLPGAIIIAPNPARGPFSVMLDPLEEDATVELIDMQGHVLWRRAAALAGSNMPVEVTDLPAGAYLVRILAGQHSRTGRLIVPAD